MANDEARRVISTSACGVFLRRHSPRFVGRRIDIGHQWIEVVDPHGKVEYSAGFWYRWHAFVPWGPGRVCRGDPFAGKQGFVRNRPIRKKNDCGKTCEEVRQCLKDEVDLEEKNPPRYNYLFSNCWDWSERILGKCCLVLVPDPEVHAADVIINTYPRVEAEP
jgi:hypothetical protein